LVNAYVPVVKKLPPTPLGGGYCNALLIAHWPIRQN